MSKVLVFVHGAGKIMSNYADETLADIALVLGAEPQSYPVYYADICNIGSPVSVSALTVDQPAPPVESPEVTQFKTAFMMQVQSDVNTPALNDKALSIAAVPPTGPTVSTQSLTPQFLADVLATEVNQIARYLFDPISYSKVQARMTEGLAKAAQLGDTLVVASHSLGTAVAFDALRAVGTQYNISTFFTLGSPLAKLRRLGQRTANLGCITRGHVLEWQNWYDTTDPVSNAISPSFPLAGYRIRDIFVNNAPILPESHNYFGNPEVRAAIADALR